MCGELHQFTLLMLNMYMNVYVHEYLSLQGHLTDEMLKIQEKDLMHTLSTTKGSPVLMHVAFFRFC